MYAFGIQKRLKQCLIQNQKRESYGGGNVKKEKDRGRLQAFSRVYIITNHHRICGVVEIVLKLLQTWTHPSNHVFWF